MNDITLSNQPPADELARLTLAAREALTDTMVDAPGGDGSQRPRTDRPAQ